MQIGLWGLMGFFAAALINRAADCWLNPARLECDPARHPVRLWAVWVGVPALFIFLAARGDASGELWPVCLFAALLVLLAVVDLEQRRVPNVVVLPSTALALAFAAQNGQLISAAAGAALAFAAFLTLYILGRSLFGPGALGMGDVKLAAFIGAVVGLEWVPYALLLGIVFAGAGATALLLSGRARRGDSLPFGHFMALATIIALVGSRAG
jgi:leader peptidase (prepilin peptidase)/N-methyltransferase